jgi:hypothetical protein
MAQGRGTLPALYDNCKKTTSTPPKKGTAGGKK